MFWRTSTTCVRCENLNLCYITCFTATEKPSTKNANFTNRWDLFDLLLIQWNCLSKTFGTFELRQRLIQFLSWWNRGWRWNFSWDGGKLHPWTICLVVFYQPIWKICSSKMGSSSPTVGGENKKYLKQPPSHGFVYCGENSFQRFWLEKIWTKNKILYASTGKGVCWRARQHVAWWSWGQL